jgi:hypothetical protein
MLTKVVIPMLVVYFGLSLIDLIEYRTFYKDIMTKEEYHIAKYGTTKLLINYP